MSSKSKIIGGSLLGAIAIHISMVACFGGGSTNTNDGGVLDAMVDAARDVVGMETPDALAQDATSGGMCNCPSFVAPTVMYSEQSSGASTTGTGNWVDVLGAGISHPTSSATTVDLFVNGVMEAQGGTMGVATCALRIVVNGSPMGDQDNGHFVTEPRSPAAGPVDSTTAPFAFTVRVPRPAGPNTFQLQVSRTAGDANCALLGGPSRQSHRVRFYATFR